MEGGVSKKGSPPWNACTVCPSARSSITLFRTWTMSEKPTSSNRLANRIASAAILPSSLHIASVEQMKSRFLYLAAAAGFLAGAVGEFFPPQQIPAAVLDAVAGAIFLFLGAGAQKQS